MPKKIEDVETIVHENCIRWLAQLTRRSESVPRKKLCAKIEKIRPVEDPPSMNLLSFYKPFDRRMSSLGSQTKPGLDIALVTRAVSGTPRSLSIAGRHPMLFSYMGRCVESVVILRST